MALPMHPTGIAKAGREWYAKRVSSTGQWVCCSVQNHEFFFFSGHLTMHFILFVSYCKSNLGKLLNFLWCGFLV